MTDSMKFISYEPTPSIEKQRGIATILLDEKYIVRIKLVDKKDGGTFLAFGNLQGEPDAGQKTWLTCFDADRNSHREQIFAYVRGEISKQSASPRGARPPLGEPPVPDDDCPF